MMKKAVLVLGTIGFSATAVMAQSAAMQAYIGPTLGVYYPSSREIKTDLGTGGLQFGFGATPTGRPTAGSFSPQLTAIIESGNGNKLFIIPYTLGYEYHFGLQNSASTLPYVRPFAGIAYYDYSITDTSGQHFGVKRFGATGGIEAGILLGSRLKLAASYYLFTPTSSFSFSGLTISATYALLGF